MVAAVLKLARMASFALSGISETARAVSSTRALSVALVSLTAASTPACGGAYCSEYRSFMLSFHLAGGPPAQMQDAALRVPGWLASLAIHGDWGKALRALVEGG